MSILSKTDDEVKLLKMGSAYLWKFGDLSCFLDQCQSSQFLKRFLQTEAIHNR